MIRNYYTEAYKGGIVPSVVAGQLIDGTVKSPVTFADTNTPTNAATSTTLILTAVNRAILRGMYITAPISGVTPAWTINDNIIVEAVSHQATTTTITINTPKALVAGTALTFFIINQSYWKEYNLFIGTSPAPFLGSGGGIVDTAMSNAAAGAQAILTWKQPIAIGVLAAGMLVYDDGVLIGSISTIDSTTQVTLVANLTGAVADLSKLTFVYPAAASISVLTLDNRTVTITSPAEGFVLPLSVVQITATSNGLANIIALE
jgi:hypothetical protein